MSYRDVRIAEDVRDQPEVIQAELPEIIARLNAAGYDGDFRILGSGMTGVVLLDEATDRAFKVARHFQGNAEMISDEYDFLSSLAESEAAPLLPDAFSYDAHAGVLVREGISGRAGGWGSRGLREAYDVIVKAARAAGWSHPEFKENSFVIRDDGSIVMVDVGFAQRIGMRFVRWLEGRLGSGVHFKDGELRGYAYNLRMDASDGLIPPGVAAALQARMEEIAGTSLD